MSSTFPKSEEFGLTSQMRRAAVSIASNIAEGTSRFSNKEKIRFIEIAYGSTMELYCQAQIAVDLNYLEDNKLEAITNEIMKIANQLNAFKASLKSKEKESCS